MALQMTVETLEGMEEGISKLYVEKDGKFHLDVDGHDKNDDQNRIPKARLDQEIEKRKASETALNEIAESLTDDIPEDMKDLIPDLPPAQKIKWIKNANKKGLFNPQHVQNGPDSKRPGSKAPESYDGMSPQAMIAKGYKNK
ncbi:MAG: hypothetical protein WC799_05520 [Desulfobacteraceae bacterium]